MSKLRGCRRKQPWFRMYRPKKSATTAKATMVAAKAELAMMGLARVAGHREPGARGRISKFVIRFRDAIDLGALLAIAALLWRTRKTSSVALSRSFVG